VLPVLVVVAVWLFDHVRLAAGDRPASAGGVVAVLGIVGLLGFAGWALATAWSHSRGDAAPAYELSQLVRAAGAVPRSAVLYSDDPLAIAAITERQPVKLLLAPGQPNVIGRGHPTIAELEALACRRPVWVAWFGDSPAAPVALLDTTETPAGVLGRVTSDACL
jgi:hypothetical protein